jgi:predicted RNA-binding protein YlqC (UPF0109 family)
MVVDQPEAVAVTVEESDHGAVQLWVRVAPGEIGMVVGKHGRMIEAIRALVSACGAKSKQRVKLDVEEPDGLGSGGFAVGRLR